MSTGFSRRRFIGGSAAAVIGTATGASLVAGCSDDADATSTSSRRIYDFEGVHQIGVTTPPQENAMVVAFDSVAADASELQQMFRSLTDEIRVLIAGEPADSIDPLLPPIDNLIVGVDPPNDDLTVTVGVGASMFDDRYGLGPLKPRELIAMPTFPNDKPDVDQLHGDLVVQICAGTPEMCNHVLRRIMKATRDTLVLKWLMPGFNRPNTLGKGRTSTRNLLGFKDGTANIDSQDDALMDELVWIGEGTSEPAWTVGGTYAAVRLIRNRVEFWDRTSLRTQQTIIGRFKDSGAPLDGNDEPDIPQFDADPDGRIFRLDGHIRLANPRRPDTEKNRILRRGFNYSQGFDRAGQLNQGLLFVCFQKSLDDGFLAVQGRLNGEALEEYITPFGGGLFFIVPGVTGADRFLADRLFTS